MNAARFITVASLVWGIAACNGADSPPTTATAPHDKKSAPTCEMTVGWDPWAPYQYADVDGTVRGMDIEIMRAVAWEADCQLQFSRGDWSQMLQQLRSGDIDVLLAGTPLKEREAYAYFSVPYRNERFVRFTTGDQAEALADRSLREIADSGHDIGITQGYFYGEDVAELAYDSELSNQFKAAPFAELNFWRLYDGTIDVLIDDPIVAMAFFRRKGWEDDMVRLPGDVRSDVVSIMLSRESVEPAVVKRIDAAIRRLRNNGRLDSIIEKYRR